MDARAAARCKSSVNRWIMQSLGHHQLMQMPMLPKGWRRGPVVLAGTPGTTRMMPMSLLQREWRRGLVLEPAGDACDDAENAAAGESVETLTRARLEVDARPTDADKGEAIAGVDVVGVLTRNRFGVAVCSCGAFLALAFLGVTPL